MGPHEPVTQIRLPSYEIVNTPSRHVKYTVSLQGPVRSWTVTKRYSDFDALHRTLSLLATTPVYPPGKTLFSSLPSQAFNPDFLTARRIGLERYLQAILHHPNAIWRRSKDWCDFFGIPDRKANTNSAYWQKGDANNEKDDIEGWMDEYASVMDALRQVRQYVVERDKAYARGDMTVSNTASMNGKKVLNTLTQRIKTLEDALARLGLEWSQVRQVVPPPPTYDDAMVAAAANSQVGGGEWNRRHDMITTLRDERDALTRVLALPPKNHIQDKQALLSHNNTNSSNNNSGGSGSNSYNGGGMLMPTDSNSSSSSSTNVYSSSPKTSRRFGAAQETDVTRPLSNEGVLQLQQQIMATQDGEVDALLSIVRRQKQIGSAISEELDNQNQLLTEVDQGVDRTRIGVKKIGKQLDKVRGKK
ncbi:hypothetical protein SmJEL517_g00728 [Synchytrium microbalum]|uniref:PX domain-containing protein n=1 Tax=Synchytrium microbalum TaxID=1806994 RepID=A0A507CIH0_9FUNG|nr:uncharacterized protein SmJEL517_g00728 [Synchytrium microbalum]TPX37495.1 hypothetical protein SmJEL517_g00728 [Synchytrium microbalum]